MTETALRIRSLPDDLETAWRQAIRRWCEMDGSARLFRRDASLFTGADEDRWLGWLDLPSRAPAPELERLAAQVREERIRRVVLLGMGGSSLGAEALVAQLRGRGTKVAFTLLDTTEPEAVRLAVDAADSEPSLVIAASKSGGTLETELLLRVFAGRVPAERLAVVTDPGSKLERWATEGGARWILLGDPAVGGRFSVLSPFGLAAPSALGLPVDAVLAGARRAEMACRSSDESNPGVALGALMAAAARLERPLLTVVPGRPAASTFGEWLEQLVAESLGKSGRGVLPIVGERAANGRNAVLDRADARLVLAIEPEAPPTAALERAGVPVASIEIEPSDDGESLGFELFRCEVATAVAGALLGVHPFDQPDVEAAKVATRAWIERAERGETLSTGVRVAEGAGLVVFGAEGGPPSSVTASKAIDALVEEAGGAAFCALLAFLPSDAASRAALEELRAAVSDRYRLATTVGLGPRYLHSTGQFHKGGTDRGIYLVLSRDVGSVPESKALEIPGQAASFAQIHAAQALGDFEALLAKGRQALRIEISGDVVETLAGLAEAIAAPLSSEL